MSAEINLEQERRGGQNKSEDKWAQEGIDYIYFGQTQIGEITFRVYQPLTFHGACYLASDKIGKRQAYWNLAQKDGSGYWDSVTLSGFKFLFLCADQEKYIFFIDQKSIVKIFSARTEDFLAQGGIWIHKSYSKNQFLEGEPGKFLKNCIDNLEEPVGESIDAIISKFPHIFAKNSDGTIDKIAPFHVDLDLFIENGKFRCRFKNWKGGFSISSGKGAKFGLQSLEGMPQYIEGSCIISKCTSLKTLEGGPIKVGGGFDCSGLGLVSLEGGPQEVGSYYDCSKNNLKTLDGAPRVVGEKVKESYSRLAFNCEYNKLTSLKGGPQEILYGDYLCGHNPLTSLEGAPEKVRGNFSCDRTLITSLKGGPKTVGESYDCTSCKLTSLEGAPKEIAREFDCRYNRLTSLKDGPNRVGLDYSCDDNCISSLDCAPSYVGRCFSCRNNNITSLENILDKDIANISIVEGNTDSLSLESINLIKHNLDRFSLFTDEKEFLKNYKDS